jgi:O-antigen ligase
LPRHDSAGADVIAAIRRILQVLAWAFVAAACVLPYLVGTPLAYGLLAAYLVFCIWSPLSGRRFELDAAGLLFGVAFVLLLVVNTVNGDPLVTANFLMPALFIPAVTGLRSFGHHRNGLLVARLALLGVAAATLVAVYQVVGQGQQRAAGFGTDALWSSTAALAIGWIALIGTSRASGAERYLFFAGPVLAVLVLLLAGARGPLLMAVPLLLVVAMAMERRLWPAFLVMAAVSGVLFFFGPSRGRFDSVMQMTGELATGAAVSDYSASVRKILLDAGIAAFQQSPWLGHGWGKFLEATAPFTGRSDWGTGHHGFHLHSDPLDFAVAGGVLGLLAYILLIIAPVVGAWRSVRDSQYRARLLGAALLSAAYFGCGVTNALFGYEFHTTLYVCLAAILLGFCRDAEVKA